MSVLLVGDATEDYAVSTAPLEAAIFQNGFSFIAAESGTVEELWLRTNSETNTCTSVLLGLFPDNGTGLAPTDTLLASVEVAGTPPPDSWIGGTITGVAEIVAGETYWLASRGRDGTLHFNCLSDGGGLGRARVNNVSPDFITWGTSFSELSSLAPIGFKALGTPAPGSGDTPPRVPDLIWHVTGLWYPDATAVAYYGRIKDPTDDSYLDTLNDQSTGQVTFSIDGNEKLATQLIGHAYARMLKIYDSGQLAYWGPYKLARVDMAARICTLNTVDPSLRLSRHYLRRGDLVIGEGAVGGLTAANDDKSQVPVDHTGLRLLRDAALNTDEQTAEGYPDLGIIDGFNDYVATPFNLMGVQRGDQVFSQMQQLSQSLGPDFEFEAIEDVVGAYARMNTYAHQGRDISAEVVFHFGTGKKNLENLVVDEGAKYTTHVHVLPRDPDGQTKYRFTEPNPAAALETGPYVDWDATDYDSTGIPADKVEDVLRAYGKDVIAAYGRPLIQITMTLPVDGPGVPLYRVHFKMGDTVGVAGRVVTVGDDIPNVDIPVAPYRITSVRRKRDGEGIRSEITAIGDMVAALGDATGGDSEA